MNARYQPEDEDIGRIVPLPKGKLVPISFPPPSEEDIAQIVEIQQFPQKSNGFPTLGEMLLAAVAGVIIVLLYVSWNIMTH